MKFPCIIGEKGELMPIIEETLKDKNQTVARIFQIAKRCCDDLEYITIEPADEFPVAASDTSLFDFFDFVKNIPYLQDKEPLEVVARPSIIFERYISGIGKDCKKTAVLIGSWLEYNGFPWRLVVVSTRADKQPHHIFVQGRYPNKNSPWVNLDATYSNMKIGDQKRVTKAEFFNEPSIVDPLR